LNHPMAPCSACACSTLDYNHARCTHLQLIFCRHYPLLTQLAHPPASLTTGGTS
jgi:hypothetical protein